MIGGYRFIGKISDDGCPVYGFIERKQNESNSNIVFFTNSKKSGNFAQTIEEIYNKNIAC